MPALARPKTGKGRPRLMYPNKSTAQRKEQKVALKFTQNYQNVFMSQQTMAEGHSSHPLGLYFYQEGGKTFASLPLEMIQTIQQCPHFEEMKKDCAVEVIELLKDILAQDPRTHILTPQQYLKNVENGMMPPMRNHNVLKELVEKSMNPVDQTRFVMMEFKNFEWPIRPDTPGPQNHK